MAGETSNGEETYECHRHGNLWSKPKVSNARKDEENTERTSGEWSGVIAPTPTIHRLRCLGVRMQSL